MCCYVLLTFAAHPYLRRLSRYVGCQNIRNILFHPMNIRCASVSPAPITVCRVSEFQSERINRERMSAVRIVYRLVGFQNFLPGRFQYIAANSDTLRSEGGMVAKLGVLTALT